MKLNIPKYYDPKGKISFEADSCAPLQSAWKKNEIELTALARGTYPGNSIHEGEITGVRSIGYWDIKNKQDWGLEWHTNEGVEICFLESGKLDFLVKKESFDLQTGDITITRPWILHKLGSPNVGSSKLHWIIVDVLVRHPHQEWKWPGWVILNKTDLAELTRYLRQNEQPVWKANKAIRNCFARLEGIIKNSGGKPYDSRIKIEVNILLVLLLELFREGNIELDVSLVQSKRTVKLFLQTLESRIDEEWNVEKMADFCKLGITRFSHYCKELTNCPPMEYLNRLRLQKAAELLKSGSDLKIIDIAYICGFSSNHYFNYAFKKYFKKTPSQVKKTINTG